MNSSSKKAPNLEKIIRKYLEMICLNISLRCFDVKNLRRRTNPKVTASSKQFF
ncbi:hypothetical protein LguiB_009097 [Lonicera macranthoides]